MARRSSRSTKVDFHPTRPQMRRHSTGQARVTLSGKTHYLGAFDSLEAQERYVALVKRWEANGRKPLEPAATVVTVDQLLPKPSTTTVRKAFDSYLSYLDETGRYHKHGQATSERSLLKLAIDELCEQVGGEPIESLDEKSLLSFRDQLERRAHLTRRGINRKIQMLKRALRWMRPRGIITREQWLEFHALEPLKRGEMPAERERKQPKRAVTFEEVEIVAKKAGPVVGAMMLVQAMTSMRPGEVCAMRWQDIDQTPVIVDGQRCWTYSVYEGKTAHHGHETIYPIPPDAQKLLKPLRSMSGAFVFSPRVAMKLRGEVLRRGRKTPPTKQMQQRDAGEKRVFKDSYSVTDYGQAVDRAVGRTKVRRFTPHEIRHGFVTKAARDHGVVQASAAANHRNISTTERYLHADRQDAFRVVVAMQQDRKRKQRSRRKKKVQPAIAAAG